MKRITSAILSTALIASVTLIVPLTTAMAASVGSMGSFSTVEKATKGKAKILQDGNRTYIELGTDFKTSKDGPDLKVILYGDKKIPLHLKGKTYYKLGALKNYTGRQRYEIPSSVNLNKIKTVGIYCEKYDATFGYAPLN